MSITKYTLVDAQGHYTGEFDAFSDAVEAAKYGDNIGQYGVVSITYVFDDSELVWTPDGSDVWPPE